MFRSVENRCFQMTFTNGITVSMNVGACGYNDNHDSLNFIERETKTRTVEVAVWNKNNKWITKKFFPNADGGEVSVAGYVTMKEFQKALIKIINYRE